MVVGSRDRTVAATLALAASILLLAWPQISLNARGVAASYAVVTALFTIVVVGVVATWRSDAEARRPVSVAGASIVAGLVAAFLVAVALYRWVRLLAWQPYHADMLIVLREATRRVLSGHNPYTVYHSYDAPWEMAMPYGPLLWGPYVVPQLLRLDFRVITIVGELFVPVWCAVAAVAVGGRGRLAASLSWLAVLGALIAMFDVQGFTLIGHTPVYWPLFPLLAILLAKGAWVPAACVLGLLVSARTTMVATVPVFLIAVRNQERRRFAQTALALIATIGLVLAPFVLWDPRAIWQSMVLSYPRVMREAVWPELVRPGLTTIGVTEWLLEHGREWLITPVQVAAVAIVYAAAWVASARGRRPLPWMALALFAFSMTTLFPVHYLYYDVLLLLVSAAVADTLRTARVSPLLTPSAISAAALVAIVLVAVRALASPYPRIAVGAGSADWPLRSGFAAAEHAGAHDFTWIVGHEARIILPRSSAAPADIVITGESPFDRGDPPQRMSAVLNGRLLTDEAIPAGLQDIRIRADRSAWWVGFNELRLVFASTVAPRDVGAGDDARPLALSVHDIRVEKQRE
jgi:hypothetical protein